MSMRQVTYYSCDVCGFESTDIMNMSKITIPVHFIDNDKSSLQYSYYQLDVCQECKEKYQKAIFEHFCDIDIDESRRIIRKEIKE